MKITAITRYKHGGLYAVLQRLNWTQKELAEQTGINIGTICNIINLKKRPSEEQSNAIQKALGAAGEYFDVLEEWPESFQGFSKGFKREETADIEMETLLGCHEAMMLPAPELENLELEDALNAEIERLPDRQKKILKSHFWDGKTLTEISKGLNISRGRASSIAAQALRKLSGRLEPVLDELVA